MSKEKTNSPTPLLPHVNDLIAFAMYSSCAGVGCGGDIAVSMGAVAPEYKWRESVEARAEWTRAAQQAIAKMSEFGITVRVKDTVASDASKVLRTRPEVEVYSP